MYRLTTLALLLILLVAPNSFSQMAHPDSISFQGMLTSPSDIPINDTVDITTKLYKGNTAVHTQIHSNVLVSNGVFNVMIGPTDTVAFDQPMTVGIKVGADTEISPRTPLQSAPFALGLRGLTLHEHGNKIRVGIGTSTPDTAAMLEVAGPIRSRLLTDSTTMLYTQGPPVGPTLTDGFRMRYMKHLFGTNLDGLLMEKTDGNQANPDGGIMFANFGSDDVRVPTLSIRGNGRVGIGTMNPTDDLDVFDVDEDGDAWARLRTANVDVVFGVHTSDQGMMSVQSDHNLVLRTNALERLRVTNNGLVGIAIENPTARLDVRASRGSVAAHVETVGDANALEVVGGNVDVNNGNVMITSDTVPQLNIKDTDNPARTNVRLTAFNDAYYWDIEAYTVSALGVYTELNFNTYGPRGTVLSIRAAGDALVAYNGATLSDGGVWTNSSSRTKKTDFESLDALAVLDKVASLPITEWRYRSEPEEVRHIGPMAEEFSEAFRLGNSNKTIGTVDADGVALVAIQGLYELVRQQQAEIERLREVVDGLR